MIGKTISHYEILEKLGAGGMGEVYRARDTQLDRDVALKVLPPAFSADNERLSRFEREAKLLASLNHPNIASIYGVISHEGSQVLVLELVEGADLAVRIAEGPVPVDEAVAIALQVAAALESAHDQGVIHRDLKPANIQITPDGGVKVLDFGLAKALDPAGDAVDSGLSKSPTLIASGTVEGVILGTAAYMSPEQARGKAVDRRADIWAFGCVLYEMLTGARSFSGETVSDTIASILAREPDLDALPESTPPRLRHLMERCLDKDPKERLRDIGEARILLEKIRKGDPEPTVVAGPPAATAAPTRSRAGWVATAVLSVVAAALLVLYLTKPTPEPELMTVSVMPPNDGPIELQGYHPGPPAISRDGRQIAFTARTPEGPFLYVRELDKPTPRKIPGTNGAGYPFWSPDGRHIGYFANGSLMRVGVDGSPPLTLAEARFGKGGSWNEDGIIIFARTFNKGIYRVAANGGEVTELTQVDPAAGQNSHRFPVFCPDGRRFLFLARAPSGVKNQAGSAVYVSSLDMDPPRLLLQTPTQVALSAGHILFMRNNVLMAQPFDTDAAELAGDAFPLIENVRYLPGAARSVFDASPGGRLVYMGGTDLPGFRLLLVDESGREIQEIGEPGDYGDQRISPDGKYVALEVFEQLGGLSDIWIYEVERGIRTRFTFSAGAESTPIWSPDGRWVAYSASDSAHVSIYRRRADGSGPAELVFANEFDNVPEDWSPDGRYIIFSSSSATTESDIYMVEAEGAPGERAAIPLQTSSYTDFQGAVSPDGNWMVFSSSESGNMEVYVTTFPQPGRKYQVSTNGGASGRWFPDGKAIGYASTAGGFYKVNVQLTDTGGFSAGTPERMFAFTSVTWDIHPDGDKFLVIRPFDPMGSPPLTVVSDWRQAFLRENTP